MEEGASEATHRYDGNLSRLSAVGEAWELLERVEINMIANHKCHGVRERREER